LPALVERSDGVSDCLNFKLSFFLTLLTNYKHGECLSYVGTEGSESLPVQPAAHAFPMIALRRERYRLVCRI
jgi:hypothetical protein